MVILMHLGAPRGGMSVDLRAALTTGVMGGLTTYSTFNYETIRFVEAGPSVLLP